VVPDGVFFFVFFFPKPSHVYLFKVFLVLPPISQINLLVSFFNYFFYSSNEVVTSVVI